MKLIVPLSIMLLVLPVGAKTDVRNLMTCIRRPSVLVRIIVAMFVAVPLLAVVLVKLSPAPRSMKGAVLLMAISAAAPFLPKKLLTLGIDEAFVESMVFVTTLLAIPLVPIAVSVVSALFLEDVSISAAAVTRSLAVTFLIPLAIGMALRAWLGAPAVQWGERLGTVGLVVLGLLIVLILVTQGATIFSLLWSAFPLVVIFAAGSLAIGHLLGGPDPAWRTALAIATVTRHPGLAILIATTNAQTDVAAPAIIAVILGTAVAAIPYTAWRKRVLNAPGPPLRVSA